VATDETLAIEVKTYSSHHIQGTSGDTLEDQLADALIWRDLSPGRIFALAVVNHYGNPVITRPDLNFTRANNVPTLRFVVLEMSGFNGVARI
jgi:hypothetical protein